jgi:acetyl esterase
MSARQGVDPLIARFQAVPATDPSLNIQAWRKANDQTGIDFGGVPVALGSVQDFNISARDGALIKIRIYKPEHAPAGKVALYFHGGGWVIGSIEGSDRVARALACDLGATVISVDYRMAPEVVFPIPNHDCADVLAWTRTAPAALGFKPEQVVLAGDSAGAHLALAIAYQAQDQGQPVQAVIAFYPCLDPNCESNSMAQYSSGYGLLGQDRMRWFWSQYRGQHVPDAALTPWLRNDLSGLCPTWIMTAQFDPLVDEGQQFALRLARAGVTVATDFVPGMLHGFIRWRGIVRQSERAIESAAQWVNTQLS